MYTRAVLLILFFCGWSNWGFAQSTEEESNLKAVFIYNFTRYVEWPATAPADNFVIGILGKSVIDEAMEEVAAANTVNNKKIIVKHFSRPEDINSCQVLFIPAGTPYSMKAILSGIGKGVLTIGEKNGAAKEGTAFNFVLIKNRLKFEANLAAIDAEELKVSSQLLKLAIIIN